MSKKMKVEEVTIKNLKFDDEYKPISDCSIVDVSIKMGGKNLLDLVIMDEKKIFSYSFYL